MGADFVKIYTTLPQAAVYAVFDEARKRGMKVVGHLPNEIKLSDAIDGGMAGIEHMTVEVGGLCDVGDDIACRQTLMQIKNAGIFLTPTLLVRKRPSSIRDPQIVELSRIASMPEILAKEWAAGLERNLNTRSEAYFEQKAQQYAREQRLTEIAIASDALILVGTDSGDFLIPPGSSIHEELELLVNAGMDVMTALYSATGRAGDYLKLSDRGHIRAGAVADLVILKSNPLDDIQVYGTIRFLATNTLIKTNRNDTKTIRVISFNNGFSKNNRASPNPKNAPTNAPTKPTNMLVMLMILSNLRRPGSTPTTIPVMSMNIINIAPSVA